MMKSNKKSRSLLGLLLALALIVGCLATTAMAANFAENEGISLEHLHEGAALITTGECPYGASLSAFNDGMEDSPYDPTPYIKMIEAGEIKPLSSDNLPEGIASLSDIRFTDVDGCPSIDLSQTENGVAPLANCDHEYCYAHQYFIHGKAADGSCSTDYYDAVTCHKCNTVWPLAYDRTVSYRVCPHNF